MISPLDFEKDIAELESKLEGLRNLAKNPELNLAQEIKRLENKLLKLMRNTYNNLSAWEKIQVARHPQRPHFSDFLQGCISDFEELSGDRNFAEDKALITGIGKFNNIPVAVMGHEKGRDTESRIKHNFGMPKPEGYRKAARVMNLAEQFKMPLLTFIDTAGAHPGIEAEERGQAEAIARSIDSMLGLKIPVISIITGEGGSGGAIALAVANKIIMLEHAIYSVVSPEGCASILWKNSEKKQLAAESQKFTAQDLIKFNIIDEIVEEPIGGAHRNYPLAITNVKQSIESSLKELLTSQKKDFAKTRYEKFMAMK